MRPRWGRGRRLVSRQKIKSDVGGSSGIALDESAGERALDRASALLPVRTRACCLAVGVTCDGDREALGIWWQDAERAKFWLAVLYDLNRRGVADV
jgi:hypothetical protein